MSDVKNNTINNAVSDASQTKALNGHVCISTTILYNGGVELYLYYDGREEQIITLTKEQKDFLIKQLSQ